MPKVEIFLEPERTSLPSHVGELQEGGTIGITNKIGEYEEVIVLHNPGQQEDSYNPHGSLEVYAAPVEPLDGARRLPAAVHMADVEVITLVDLTKPYERSITDRHGEAYTLGAYIGDSILRVVPDPALN
jgi:hypothetical protein